MAFISVNIATHKARENNLKKCIESLLECNTKADVINVYLNDYKTPQWLKTMAKANPSIVTHEQSKGDLGAAAKFYSGEHQNEGVYITIDDDLVVAKGYIGYMADAAYRYPTSIVGLHGTTYGRFPVKSYYSDDTRQINYCYHHNSHDKVVDMLGTGCIAFRASVKIKPTLADFPAPRMTDPHLFRWAKKHRKPMVCLLRDEGFVKEQSNSQDNAIWKDVAANDTKQTGVINYANKTDVQYCKNIPIDILKINSFNLGGASMEWNHIKEILSICNEDTRLVEFGSGKTTPIFAMTVDLVSFEHDSAWCKAPSSLRPLKYGWYSLSHEDIELINCAEVILIDGPIGSTGERYNLPIEVLRNDAVIFCDDCHREKDLQQATNIMKLKNMKMELIQGYEKVLAKLTPKK